MGLRVRRTKYAMNGHDRMDVSQLAAKLKEVRRLVADPGRVQVIASALPPRAQPGSDAAQLRFTAMTPLEHTTAGHSYKFGADGGSNIKIYAWVGEGPIESVAALRDLSQEGLIVLTSQDLPLDLFSDGIDRATVVTKLRSKCGWVVFCPSLTVNAGRSYTHSRGFVHYGSLKSSTFMFINLFGSGKEELPEPGTLAGTIADLYPQTSRWFSVQMP